MAKTKFNIITSTCVPLPLENVDTDQIIPARIYLGVHYPGDLLVGGIIGGFGGWLFCTIAHKIAIYLEPSTRTKRKDIKQWPVTIYVGLLTVLGIIIYSIIKSW